MNLGNKIKELRQRNCITQEQLANHLSVSPQCISTVSYTHLDVYKRQILSLPERSITKRSNPYAIPPCGGAP